MKKMILAGILLTVYGCLQGVAQDPVSWKFSTKKVDATTYEVRIDASLAEGWHIYAQSSPDGGPVPTAIAFTKNALLLFEGKVKEAGKIEEHFEPLFGVMVKQYSTKVAFIQKVKLKTAIKTSVKGDIEFMVCNDETCLPPKKVPFSIALN